MTSTMYIHKGSLMSEHMIWYRDVRNIHSHSNLAHLQLILILVSKSKAFFFYNTRIFFCTSIVDNTHIRVLLSPSSNDLSCILTYTILHRSHVCIFSFHVLMGTLKILNVSLFIHILIYQLSHCYYYCVMIFTLTQGHCQIIPDANYAIFP